MRFSLVFLALLLVFSGPALAYGPGMHARESQVVLEELAQADPTWAALADEELAEAYLVLGSISPDFQNLSDTIGFGHSKGLSYHLLDLAIAQDLPPRFHLFALGHLTHAGGSDAAAEQFLTPAIFAHAPLGMFDIVVGEDEPKGESEGIVEGFGDLILGDWHAVGDALWYLWLESPEAPDRMKELFLWYCNQGAAYHNKPTDCDGALQELVDLIGQVEGLFANLGQDELHNLIDMLLAQPPEDLADLVFAGSTGGLLGFDVTPGPHTESEIERFKNSVLVDLDYWLLYEEMADLGPSFTVTFYEERLPAGAWPTWVKTPMIFGNIRSVMNFLPDRFAPWPKLIVDDMTYEDLSGQPVIGITSSQAGDSLAARVRFYSMVPFSGTVLGKVVRDAPGMDRTQDTVVAEATLAVDVDPTQYGLVDRHELIIPFVPEAVPAAGYVVELYLVGEELPWFSTSWDAIWGSGVLPFDWPVYKDNFGTYGHWPASLPVTDAVLETGSLAAIAHVAPAGPGIEGATVSVGAQTQSAGANGLALFTPLAPGEVQLTASAPSYVMAEETAPTATVVAGSITWASLYLHAVPVPSCPTLLAPDECLEVDWDCAPFAGQAKSFAVQLHPVEEAETILCESDVESPPATLCPGNLEPGMQVAVTVLATYQDDSPGVPGVSPPVTIIQTPLVEPEPDVVDEPDPEPEPDLVAEDFAGHEFPVVPDMEGSGDQPGNGDAIAAPDHECDASAAEKPPHTDAGCQATTQGHGTGLPVGFGLLLLVGVALRRRRA